MAGEGGYQAPGTPAPVSGPGALSQRTDVQAPMPMTGGAYGESQYMDEIQSGADMFADPMGAAPTPLLAPSQRPDLPVTDGAAIGPGRGVEAVRGDEALAEVRGISPYLPMMEKMAARPDSPRAFRALVQYVKALNG